MNLEDAIPSLSSYSSLGHLFLLQQAGPLRLQFVRASRDLLASYPPMLLSCRKQQRKQRHPIRSLASGQAYKHIAQKREKNKRD